MRLFVLQDKNGKCICRTRESVNIEIIENQDAACFNEKEYFWEVEKLNTNIEVQNIENFNTIKNKLEKEFCNVEDLSLNFKSDKVIFNIDSFLKLKTETLNIDLDVKRTKEPIYVKSLDIDKYKEVVNTLLQEKDIDNTNLYDLDEEEIRGLLNAPAYICHLVDKGIVSLEEVNYSILKCIKDILPISENQLRLVNSIYEEDILTTYCLDNSNDLNIVNSYFDKGFYTIKNNPTIEIKVHNGEGKVYCSGEFENVRNIYEFINNIINHTSNVILNKGIKNNNSETLFTIEKKIG